MQYYLFHETEIAVLRQENIELKKLFKDVQRGAFVRIDALKKEIKSLRDEMTEIKQITAHKKAELVPFFGELVEMTN